MSDKSRKWRVIGLFTLAWLCSPYFMVSDALVGRVTKCQVRGTVTPTVGGGRKNFWNF